MGVYVAGAIEGSPVLFTADTGASHTVVSTRVYERLNKETRPPLGRALNLKGAGGESIRDRGVATFNFKLGPLEIIREAVVADISDDALLGYDVLKGGEDGPADIMLSRNEIVIGGVHVPCFQVGGHAKKRRVTVAGDTPVPGMAEALVDVYIERVEGDDFDDSSFIVEATDGFRDRYSLVMATTLVDVNRSPTCKVRVLNPLPGEVVLRQDAEVACAERIGSVMTVVADAEGSNEDEDLCRIRRVQYGSAAPKARSVSLPIAKGEAVPAHLVDLYKRASVGRSSEECEVVAGLLTKFQDSFSRDEWDIGLTHLVEHEIKTGDAPPIKQRPRRVPLAYAEEEKRAIEDLLKKGVIEESTSPWASPIVLVKKKNGQIRPCVDYRRLNALVKPDGFPLPRVQDCLDAVAGATLFSSFDLTSGYFQIPLKKSDRPKSAFACKFGQFQMTRLPFGLNSSSACFQRMMEIALQGLQWETCLVYVDDIITYGANFTEHMTRVDEVLSRIRDAGLKLRPDKCHLLQAEVVFLGHVVSGDGVRPDPNNISKILSWPTPETAKQVKQFVATGNYYRRFVKDFAKRVKPLVDLTRKDVEFHWTDDCQKAFEDMKGALVSPEVMGYPLNEGGQFYLDVDASGVGIGGVLSQVQEGRERVIAYGSRALNRAERNYCVTEKELLAVVHFVQHYRQYLLGRRFTVRSDHQALVWLYKLKEPSGKIARWIDILAAFDFQIEYRPGRKQAHCDALSRCEFPKDCTCPNVDNTEVLKCGPCAKCKRRAETMASTWMVDCEQDGQKRWCAAVSPTTPNQSSTGDRQEVGTAEINCSQPVRAIDGPSEKMWLESNWLDGFDAVGLREAQRQDLDIQDILAAVEAGRRQRAEEMLTKSPAARHYWLLWENLVVRDGVLFKHFSKRDGTGTYCQLLVPTKYKDMVLHQMHSALTSGHMGVKRTTQKTAQSFYWFGMKTDVVLFVRQCDVCAANRPLTKTPKAPMGHLRSGAAWDVLAMDYMGPFPVTERGNRYILVMTDHFTKYVEVIPVPNQTAEDCARQVLNQFVARWGTPIAILTDQGTVFENRLFKELCSLLEVKKKRTSVRNPRGNGQTERFNRTLIKMIKSYLVDQEEWDLYLGCVAGAYRASPNETTKLTPNMLCMGREVRMPANIQFRDNTGVPGGTEGSLCSQVMEMRERMRHAHEVAREHIGISARRNKDMYDAGMSFHRYQEGDLIWYLHETRRKGATPKLERMYDGPLPVLEKLSEVNFRIQLGPDGQTKVVHHNKLKPYEGKGVPRWVNKVVTRLRGGGQHKAGEAEKE